MKYNARDYDEVVKKGDIRYILKNEKRKYFEVEDLSKMEFTKDLIRNEKIDKAHINQLNKLVDCFYDNITYLYRDDKNEITKNSDLTLHPIYFIKAKLKNAYEEFLTNDLDLQTNSITLDETNNKDDKMKLTFNTKLAYDNDKLQYVVEIKKTDGNRKSDFKKVSAYTNRDIDFKKNSELTSNFNNSTKKHNKYKSKIEEVCDGLIDDLYKKLENNNNKNFSNLWDARDLKPLSYSSDKYYKGVNRLILGNAMQVNKDYTENKWITRNKIKQNNFTLKENSNNHQIVFYADRNLDGVTDKGMKIMDDIVLKVMGSNLPNQKINKEQFTEILELFNKELEKNKMKKTSAYSNYLCKNHSVENMPYKPYYQLVNHNVYNVSKLDGYVGEKVENKKEKTDDEIEKMIRALEFSSNEAGVPIIRHKDETSFFATIGDREKLNKDELEYYIKLPVSESFTSSKEELYVMLHELSHSTKSVYDRNFISKDDSYANNYAKEEMLAEFGVLITASKLGVDFSDLTTEHLMGYLKHYDGDVRIDDKFTPKDGLAILKQNPKLLYTILNDAEKASDLIFDRYEKTLTNNKFLENEKSFEKELEMSKNKTKINVELIKDKNGKESPLYEFDKENYFSVKAFDCDKFISDKDLSKIEKLDKSNEIMKMVYEKASPKTIIVSNKEFNIENLDVINNYLDKYKNVELNIINSHNGDRMTLDNNSGKYKNVDCGYLIETYVDEITYAYGKILNSKTKEWEITNDILLADMPTELQNAIDVIEDKLENKVEKKQEKIKK